MAEGRRRETWNHTSHLLAFIHNFGFRKVSWKDPKDFNPMAPKDKPVRMPLAVLAPMFTGKN